MARLGSFALSGSFSSVRSERRKARRIIETAWRSQPHPDLADIYAHVRPSDSARERLARVEALARQAPGHIEAALAVARAKFDETRSHRDYLRCGARAGVERCGVNSALVPYPKLCPRF
jgi:uncharacterized membrane-anchored protein